MATTGLQTSFRIWCDDITKNRLDANNYPTTLEGAKRMLDEALWQAYQEGYKQCQADVKKAVAKLGKG